ncbi:MAG: hypothetical protein IKV03_05080 [Alphaproteobacteria bacterium]|nr:hypothetical protein [Alphaproteobacteria bacterium]
MRLFLYRFFFLLMIPLAALAEEISGLNQIKTFWNDPIVYDLSGQPFSGKLEFDMDDRTNREKISTVFWGIDHSWRGKTKISVSYKHGKKEGKWHRYEDGILTEELEFKNGLLDGWSIGYDYAKIGEIREKTQYKEHVCVQRIEYYKGKPRTGFKRKEEKQNASGHVFKSKATLKRCTKKNSVIFEYYSTGETKIEADKENKTKIFYLKNGTIWARIQPAPEKQKADMLLTVYYENKQPMLILLIKEYKAISGEYYDLAGKKNVLDEATATDYLLDLALSYVLEDELQ